MVPPPLVCLRRIAANKQLSKSICETRVSGQTAAHSAPFGALFCDVWERAAADVIFMLIAVPERRRL